ncbi:hypothetical protein NFI96_022971 [Prochilodus magdalenae]|nr:hypothetical protein NFI96_022971 [Prochilodus magdalenae]
MTMCREQLEYPHTDSAVGMEVEGHQPDSLVVSTKTKTGLKMTRCHYADECALFGEEICKGGYCLNTAKGYECYCKAGLYYDDVRLQCVDTDECLDESNCIDGQCFNNHGSYQCFCPPPMVLAPDNKHCILPDVAAKMVRGSPIPPLLLRKIVQQYQSGVTQPKIAKTFKLSSSTVHNIIKRFRESGTIAVRKGQGRKPLLAARDLRALKRHRTSNRNATVQEITEWAQEHFQKASSVNTIHRAIRRCQLYSAKRKPFLSKLHKLRRLHWARGLLKWSVENGRLFCGQMSHDLKFFMEHWDAMSSGPERTRITQAVINAPFRSLHH